MKKDRREFDWREQADDIVGPEEIARRFGVERGTFDKWEDRPGAGLPAPDLVLGKNGRTRLWSWVRTIEPWGVRTGRLALIVVGDWTADYEKTVPSISYTVPSVSTAPIEIQHDLDTYATAYVFDGNGALFGDRAEVRIEHLDRNRLRVYAGNPNPTSGAWVPSLISKVEIVG